MDGVVRHLAVATLDCSWLQCQENSLDPVHVEWLHGYFANFIAEMRGQDIYYRGKPRKHQKIGFDRFEWGIYKRHFYVDSKETDTHWADGHPIVFPYFLRQSGDGFDRSKWNLRGPSFQIRVPRDDTHTDHWWVLCHPAEPGEPAQQDEDVPLYQPTVPEVNEKGYVPWNLFESNPEQDLVAWITQGPVADRTKEHLGRSDKGIIMFRRMLEENIRLVEQGQDPMNTFRDPAQNVYLGMKTEDAHHGGIGATRAPERAQAAQQAAPEMFGFRSRQGMQRKLETQQPKTAVGAEREN
jgi:5,5'-dehydrodivanillate O-demethylase